MSVSHSCIRNLELGVGGGLDIRSFAGISRYLLDSTWERPSRVGAKGTVVATSVPRGVSFLCGSLHSSHVRHLCVKRPHLDGLLFPCNGWVQPLHREIQGNEFRRHYIKTHRGQISGKKKQHKQNFLVRISRGHS